MSGRSRITSNSLLLRGHDFQEPQALAWGITATLMGFSPDYRPRLVVSTGSTIFMAKKSSMQTYIALLRGINVGGNKKIKMEDLRNYCSSLGWEDVGTYIQSGNIVFRHVEQDPQKIAQELMEKLATELGFSAWTMVFPQSYWDQVIRDFPFSNLDELNPSRTLLIFYAEPLAPAHLATMQSIDLKNDRYEIIDQVAYLYCTDGISNSPLADASLQKKIKVENTSRNWRTVLKLQEMANERSH